MSIKENPNIKSGGKKEKMGKGKEIDEKSIHTKSATLKTKRWVTSKYCHIAE
jgi:hypothetical protein